LVKLYRQLNPNINVRLSLKSINTPDAAIEYDLEERYRQLREKYREFDRRIPQEHIASYMEMTAEFFSVVRSKVLKAAY
jgi:hypothetical protein